MQSTKATIYAPTYFEGYDENSRITNDRSKAKTNQYYLQSDMIIRFGKHSFSLGIVPTGCVGRQVTQGPLVPGPWAFASPCATVIADNPAHGTAAEIARNKAAGMEFTAEVGDIIVMDGIAFECSAERNYGYLKLTLAADQAAAGAQVTEPNADEEMVMQHQRNVRDHLTGAEPAETCSICLSEVSTSIEDEGEPSQYAPHGSYAGEPCTQMILGTPCGIPLPCPHHSITDDEVAAIKQGLMRQRRIAEKASA